MKSPRMLVELNIFWTEKKGKFYFFVNFVES